MITEIPWILDFSNFWPWESYNPKIIIVLLHWLIEFQIQRNLTEVWKIPQLLHAEILESYLMAFWHLRLYLTWQILALIWHKFIRKVPQSQSCCKGTAKPPQSCCKAAAKPPQKCWKAAAILPQSNYDFKKLGN